MTGRVIPFRVRANSSAGADDRALRILDLDFIERLNRAQELDLEDPELLLSICGLLAKRVETDPERIRAEAQFFHEFIAKPERPLGLFDERDYFLGELALIAGCASRFLFRREEARRWFDFAESSFRHTVNAVADWARVSYQRLALRLEEREIAEVLELVPSLIHTFRKLSMFDEALKCRFLEGVAFINTERLDDAVLVFREICAEAERLGNDRLLAIACNNLVQVHALIGDSDQALAHAQDTLKLFYKLDNRVGLAKLQWGVGTLLRTQGDLGGALEAYATAKQGFQSLGMPADVAALGLVLADIQLERGDEAAAIREILTALPIIQAERMVPEGMAALSLLQDSIRHQVVDRAALRQLHGYFEERAGS